MQNEKDINRSLIKIALGSVSGLVVYVILSGVIAYALMKGVPINMGGPLIPVATRTMVVFVAALTTGLMVKDRILIHSITAAIVPVIVWFVITLLFLEKSPVGIYATVIGTLVGICAAILLIFTKMSLGQGGYKKKHYR